MSDAAKTAAALLEPLTGYTPGPWKKHSDGRHVIAGAGACNVLTRNIKNDTRLIAAAPAMRDAIAALLAERERDAALMEEMAKALEGAVGYAVEYGDGTDCLAALNAYDAHVKDRD